MSTDPELRRGVYDSDYFSGAQVAIYIGDIWIDEVTSLSFSLQEPRVPLYGYADNLFKDVCRGQVIVSGSFSVNFKEAGYLWLVLQRYQKFHNDSKSPYAAGVTDRETGRKVGEFLKSFNIEETYVQEAVNAMDKSVQNKALLALANDRANLLSQKVLTGYASSARGLAGGTEMSGAEASFEAFENVLWDGGSMVNGQYNAAVGKDHRRVTGQPTNSRGFDIYITYGDYTGDDRLHHTVQKLDTVYLTGVGKQIVIDGTPIQEEYSFIAKDLV